MELLFAIKKKRKLTDIQDDPEEIPGVNFKISKKSRHLNRGLLKLDKKNQSIKDFSAKNVTDRSQEGILSLVQKSLL